MIKIAIVSGLYPNIRNGVSDYLYIYTNLLAKKEYKISFITQTNFKIADSDKSISFNQIIEKNPFSIFKALRIIRKKEIDFVHLEFPSSEKDLMIHIFLIAFLTPVILRKRIILRLHEYSERPRLKKIAIVLMGLAASQIVTNNNVDLKQLNSLKYIGNILAKKNSMIPIGSNIKKYSFTTDSLNKLKSDFSNNFLIGFFGDIYLSHQQKGGVIIIDIIKTLISKYNKKDFLFIIIGGNNKVVNYFNEQLGKYSKYIYFTGYLSEKDVSKHIQICNIMIAPFKNGFIFNRGSLLASIVHNKCILTTTNESEEYPDDLKSSLIFLKKGVPSLFADKINTLIENKRIIIEYEGKISLTSNFFSWERVVNDFDSLYSEKFSKNIY